MVFVICIFQAFDGKGDGKWEKGDDFTLLFAVGFVKT